MTDRRTRGFGWAAHPARRPIDADAVTDRRGFTLIETLVVVTLLGIVALATALVFSVIVRTTPATEARADDARSLLGISTWLPADVSSTPQAPVTAPNWDVQPGAGSGCSGPEAGANLVRLLWTESLNGSSTTFTSSYRLIADGDESYIVRVTCTNSGPRSELKLTAGLPPAGDAPVSVNLVEQNRGGVTYNVGLVMLITTRDGDTLRVDASSRNPAETLGTVPSAVTTSSSSTTTEVTTTTTTTTTTIDPSTSSSSVPNTAPVAGPVTVTVQRDQLIVVTLAATDADGDPLTPSFGPLPDISWSVASVSGLDVTFAATNPGAGIYVIDYTVSDPSGATSSSTITITLTPIPCTGAAIIDIDPNPVAKEGSNNSPASLVEPVEVTISKTGDCVHLVLRYTPQNTTYQVAFGDSIVRTLPATDTQRWQPGSNTLTLVEVPPSGIETVRDTETLTVVRQ